VLVAIFSHKLESIQKTLVENWLMSIKNEGFELILFEEMKYYNFNQKFEYFKNSLPENVRLIVTLGGDGTFLKSVKFSNNGNIPILGVNSGRLGFLTSTVIEESISVIKQFRSGNCLIERKSLIEIIEPNKVFQFNIGLNDVTVLKTDSSSMITIRIYLDEKHLNTYWADGLIIATSTGSTAYSLSCGGPIVSPGNDVFVITPISSHNLNARPIVISSKSNIRVEVESRTNNYMLSLDSHSSSVDGSTILHIKQSNHQLQVVRSSNYNYFDNLRNKMLWGLDSRN
jgi:NAD+ kinase